MTNKILIQDVIDDIVVDYVSYNGTDTFMGVVLDTSFSKCELLALIHNLIKQEGRTPIKINDSGKK